jgi:cell division protein FtsI/penicillin-binding protein 2
VRILLQTLAFTLFLAIGSLRTFSQPPQTWQSAAAHASQIAPTARIVVLDIPTNRLLASTHLGETARTLAAPGSTLKPLILYALIAANRWHASNRIACTRKLTIAGRSLNCSHPPSDPMDARQALAWSCNTYFNAVSRSIAPNELRTLLAPSGLLSQTGLAPTEATASFRDPQAADQTSLAVLGVDGLRVTPFELAEAYRWLALQLATHPNSEASQTVQQGLEDSASFGIANASSLGGVPVAGKTGTANLGAGTPSHGWFVALAPAAHPQVVLVVYLQAGHGADAAQVAANLLTRSPLRQPAKSHP